MIRLIKVEKRSFGAAFLFCGIEFGGLTEFGGFTELKESMNSVNSVNYYCIR